MPWSVSTLTKSRFLPPTPTRYVLISVILICGRPPGCGRDACGTASAPDPAKNSRLFMLASRRKVYHFTQGKQPSLSLPVAPSPSLPLAQSPPRPVAPSLLLHLNRFFQPEREP